MAEVLDGAVPEIAAMGTTGMTAKRFEEALDDLIGDHLASKIEKTPDAAFHQIEIWETARDEICSALEKKLIAFQEDRLLLQRLRAGGSMRDERGFGWALKHLQLGEVVRRRSWIAKGIDMSIALRQELRQPDGTSVDCEPYIAMFRCDAGHLDVFGQRQPGQVRMQQGWWVCSHADLLATDWEKVLDEY
jgi:hypothetical protein